MTHDPKPFGPVLGIAAMFAIAVLVAMSPLAALVHVGLERARKC